MTDEQKKELNRTIREYSTGMNAKMIKVFRLMVDEINEVLGVADDRPVHPPEGRPERHRRRSSWSRSRTSTLEWIKAPKAAASEQAEAIYARYWPRIEEIQQGDGPQARAHEARRRAALRRAGDGQGLRGHQAASWPSATRWPAGTATRASSPASCRKRTCRSWRTARRWTSC